jgi:hypothetical protein
MPGANILAVMPVPTRARSARRSAECLGGVAVRSVIVAQVAGKGTVEHQGARALRIGRREEHAHRSALGDAEEGGALRAGGVHHRPHVVHPFLQPGKLGDPIRQACAAAVEEDQAREGRQPAEERGEGRVLPRLLDVRHPSRHQHQIERAHRRSPGRRG